MGVSDPPSLAISFCPPLLKLSFPFLGSQTLCKLCSFVVSEVWSSSLEKHRRPSLGFGPGKGNGWLRVGVGKGRDLDDRWIDMSLFRFTGFLYDSYNASDAVVLLCGDRTKDMANPSGDKARSEHRLRWMVVKWLGSEIRRGVSEIKNQSPFVERAPVISVLWDIWLNRFFYVKFVHFSHMEISMNFWHSEMIVKARSQKQDEQDKEIPWSLPSGQCCIWIVLASGPLPTKQSDTLLFGSLYLCMPEVKSCKVVYLHQKVVTCSYLEFVSSPMLESKKSFFPLLILGECTAAESIKIWDGFVLHIKILWYFIRMTAVVVSREGVEKVELLVVIFLLGLREVKTLDFRSLYVMFLIVVCNGVLTSFIVKEPRAKEASPETSRVQFSNNGSSNEMLADDLDKDHPHPA
ncbi:hypothetical protein V6N13_147115 [Hibiscus sabdariffa]|uniref:Uncharacterized protein n=1 Tax=Hibiscus sabdariffa TaxID=183260 RepID=A0ABR2TUV1_9ROSI